MTEPSLAVSDPAEDDAHRRSRDRYRRAGLTGGAGLVAKAIGVLASFILVPLTLGYLGNEQYGLWMTISSASLMLAFADLGIGNGVLNLISEAHGRDDRDMARRAVSSGAFLLSIIAVTIVAVFALCYPFIPWAQVFNVTGAKAMSEAGPATAVFIVVWAINIPLDIVQRVQIGYQKGFVNYMWQGLGSVFTLVTALIAIHLQAGLPWLVLALTGGPLLGVALNGVVEFGWTRPWLRPAWSCVRRSVARRVMRLGAMFFLLQLAMTVGYATDNIVIAQVLGSAQVTQFAVPARLFAFVLMLVSMLMAPLWPAYGEALARGDAAWAARTLWRSLILTGLLAGVPSVVLVVFGSSILHLWVGGTVNASTWLLLGLGLWTTLGSLGGTAAFFLNGSGRLRFQVVCALIMAPTALVLKIVFANWWGVAGVAWATVIPYALFVVIPTAIYLPRLLRRMMPPETSPAPEAV